MEKRENLTVELFGNSGACPQECPHCPNGRKPETEAFSFPKPAIELFQALQDYKKSRGERIGKLNLALGNSQEHRIEVLPLDPFPRHLSFLFGNILPEQAEVGLELEVKMIEIAKTSAKAIRACLGDQVPAEGKPSSIAVSTLPVLNESLNLEFMAEFSLFFRAMMVEILKDRRKWEQLEFHFANNAVPVEAFKKYETDLVERLRKMATLSFMLKGMLGKKLIIAEEKGEHIINLTKQLTHYQVDFILENNLAIALSERLIAQTKEHKGYTELRERELTLSLLPEGVWVEHSTSHTKDKSVRLKYDEVQKIIEEALKSGDRIQDAIYAKIEGRRKKTLKVAG